MESKLMPCICGGEDGWACWKTSDETYYLECESCGYKTKEHKTVADAETEWDKRNGAPMTTNEPTTGEIVRALRCIADDIECKDCRYKYPVGNAILCDHEQMNGNAADRLESQEKTIATMRGDNFDATSVTNVLAYLDTVMGLIHCADGIKDLIVSMQGTAEELTARAEQAEKERDAAIKALTEYEDALYPTVEDVMRDLNTL